MTENEARILLIGIKEDNNWGGSIPEVFSIAIQALEETQQYRAIGVTSPKKLASDLLLVHEDRIKLKNFEAIGTIEEFKALKEKNVAKKPIIKPWSAARCPMSRLIDADAFKASLEELQPKLDLLASMCVREVIELMEEQPTAYDVDKVVEELEDNFNSTDNKDIRIAYHHAIKIVRKGGVE